MKRCSICNSAKNVQTCIDKVLCRYHGYRYYKYGDPFKRLVSDANEILENEDCCEMKLYNRKGQTIKTTIFDKQFKKEIMKYKWSLSTTGYASTKQNRLYLHQLILLPPSGFECDHINGNTLDNRLQNLRIVIHSDNMKNQKARGYYYDKRDKKWIVKIMINGREIKIGRYYHEADAYVARIWAEKIYFGKFASRRMCYELYCR